MRRRAFIALLGGAVAWPLGATGVTATIPVIGFLAGGSPDAYSRITAAFLQGLKESGYVERQNVAIEYRWAADLLAGADKVPHEERYGRALITTRDFQWSWQGQHLVLGLDEAGDGALVLLLPALSSISTRGEMHPLMERLASQFRVVAIDWPGFGTRSSPNVRWTPDALSIA